MDINRSEVKRILKLAGLAFSEEDMELYRKDLMNIVDLFDQLKKVNTDGVEPLYNTIDDDLKLREDNAIKENSRDDLIKNAPRSKLVSPIILKLLRYY